MNKRRLLYAAALLALWCGFGTYRAALAERAAWLAYDGWSGFERANVRCRAGQTPDIRVDFWSYMLWPLGPLKADFYIEGKKRQTKTVSAYPFSQWRDRPRTLASAVSAVDTAITLELLQHGADPNQPIDLGQPDLKGHTPLYQAIAHRRRHQVALLLRHGADIEAEKTIEAYVQRPLLAAGYTCADEVFLLLLQHGADFRVADFQGRRAIHQAAACDNLPAIDFLLEKGEDVNRRDAEGATPLFYAAEQQKHDAIRRLLAAGADVNAQNGDGHHYAGYTALHIAVHRALAIEPRFDSIGLVCPPDDSKTIGALLRGGASPTASATLYDGQPGTPLELAERLKPPNLNERTYTRVLAALKAEY